MAKNSVYVIPTACIVCLLWWSNSNCVKGQPVFQTPANAVFGRDAILTCEVTFNAGTGRSWRKNGVAITSLATDISGTGRYSEISNSSSFSLVISEAVVSDEAEYYCDYNFLVSATKPLYFDRPATNEGVSCRKNSNDKMDIVISNVYPNATVDLVTLQAEGGTVETITGSLSETGSGDYYNYTWTSADVINTGKYECQITITTRSPTVIVLDCTFENCCCCCKICCFIVLIVNVGLIGLLILVHIMLTWKNHEYSIKKILYVDTQKEVVSCKDYGIKALLPGCCLCVVVIIIQLAVYFGALKQRDCEVDCDCDCEVVICLVVPIIVLIAEYAIGLVIIYAFVHLKGRNYRDPGGNADNGNSFCGRNNSILPICAGGDQHSPDGTRQQLSQRLQHREDRHPPDEPKSNTTKTDEAGSFVSGKDVKVETGGLRAQPPLPGIKSGNRNTQGLSANNDDPEMIPEKKRLTPIGQESQLEWEEKRDRSEDAKEKKKKKKSKDKEKNLDVIESEKL